MKIITALIFLNKENKILYMVFNLFKRKENETKQTTQLPQQPFPEFSMPLPEMRNEMVESKRDASSLSLDDLDEWGESSPDATSLESFYRKVDLEAEDLDRRVAEIKKRTKTLDLNSPELVDLLNLYEKARGTVNGFIQEIDQKDVAGWGTDENTTAFYKFRACKKLSQMKQRLNEVERITRQAGFTNAKVTEILHTPAEQLVNSLGSKKKK